MTAIIAIARGNKVYMGADSFISTDHFGMVSSNPKIVKNNGVLLGLSGSCRFNDLIITHKKLPNRATNMSVYKYLVTKIVPLLKKAMNTAEENGEHDIGMLVGIGGSLFMIFSDFQVSEPADRYGAVGSGYLPAYGVLHATENIIDPKQRILLALEAAEKHVPSVCGPFTLDNT
jgi:ATP-dependent protease HslVU (ClpYQ) peptidase subunit